MYWAWPIYCVWMWFIYNKYFEMFNNRLYMLCLVWDRDSRDVLGVHIMIYLTYYMLHKVIKTYQSGNESVFFLPTLIRSALSGQPFVGVFYIWVMSIWTVTTYIVSISWFREDTLMDRIIKLLIKVLVYIDREIETFL